MTMNQFQVKDSGRREDFITGSRRDVADDKPDYSLEGYHAKTRLAFHLMKGAQKYGRDNWLKGQPVSRSLQSLMRHVEQYRAGDRSEDHLAAILFNAGSIIHVEEEVELGRLPAELLDMPFYNPNPYPASISRALAEKVMKQFNDYWASNKMGLSVAAVHKTVFGGLDTGGAVESITEFLNKLRDAGFLRMVKIGHNAGETPPPDIYFPASVDHRTAVDTAGIMVGIGNLTVQAKFVPNPDADVTLKDWPEDYSDESSEFDSDIDWDDSDDDFEDDESDGGYWADYISPSPDEDSDDDVCHCAACDREYFD